MRAWESSTHGRPCTALLRSYILRMKNHYTPWDAAKYWLSIASVIAMLMFLVILMFDGAVTNGQCTFAQFITFECNRWDAAF